MRLFRGRSILAGIELEDWSDPVEFIRRKHVEEFEFELVQTEDGIMIECCSCGLRARGF